VVIPYTDEQRAIAEIGRVLAPRGVAVLYLHGPRYSLRYLLKPDICLSPGLTLASTFPSRRFVGRPVFIGHVMRK
jgi:hypothetical protein